MNPEVLAEELRRSLAFFNRSTSCLTEENSEFRPAEGALSVAQQVAHVGQTVDWFVEGAFRPEGFDLDFEKFGRELAGVTSLTSARDWVERAYANAVEKITSSSMEKLLEPLPDGEVMPGAPRLAIVGGIADHTAHHRGAITVYSRLCGHEPPMPYE